MAKKTGWAIVGLSTLVADEVMPAFKSSKYSRLVALVSGDKSKALKVARQHRINEKNIYNYDNFDEIKNNPEIDVVYITLPNNLHADFTIRAAKAGKHVLCEKPMATSSKDAQRMIDACRRANRKLMIAYRIQYEPHHRLLMEWVRNKKFGTVKLIEGFNGQDLKDNSEWRFSKSEAGGGPLVDLGIYCINTFRFLLGEEPTSVFATSYANRADARFKEVEESIIFQMRFPCGVLATGGTSYSVHESSRYRCLPDKNAWFGMDPAFRYDGLKIEISGLRENAIKENKTIKNKNQFIALLDHMSRCVLTNVQPYTPGEEGLQDQKIIEAIYKSAKEGIPVNLKKINKIDAFRGTPPK
jgi:predicted dehydrogenase